MMTMHTLALVMGFIAVLQGPNGAHAIWTDFLNGKFVIRPVTQLTHTLSDGGAEGLIGQADFSVTSVFTMVSPGLTGEQGTVSVQEVSTDRYIVDTVTGYKLMPNNSTDDAFARTATRVVQDADQGTVTFESQSNMMNYDCDEDDVYSDVVDSAKATTTNLFSLITVSFVQVKVPADGVMLNCSAVSQDIGETEECKRKTWQQGGNAFQVKTDKCKIKKCSDVLNPGYLPTPKPKNIFLMKEIISADEQAILDEFKAVATCGVTMPPTTGAPTTMAPTTLPPTTMPPTTMPPTTMPPTTMTPTTMPPTTMPPTTMPPTTMPPTTMPPTTMAPTTMPPTTMAPTTMPPTTMAPTAQVSAYQPDVACEAGKIVVTVDKSKVGNMDVANMYSAGDPTCRGIDASGFVIFSLSHDRCNPEVTMSVANHVKFSYSLTTSQNDSTSGDISRNNHGRIDVFCLYPRNKVVQVSHEVNRTYATYIGGSSGEFSFDMALYPDDTFTTSLPRGAVIPVGTPVYADIRFVNPTPSLNMFVQDCIATPVEVNSTYSYEIIRPGGCFGDDDTFEVIAANVQSKRYSFEIEAFRFTGVGTTDVYLTCNLYVCEASEPATGFCQNPRDCSASSKRAPRDHSQSFSISFGPMEVW